MAENKQNSDNVDINSTTNDKTVNSGGGSGGASTKQAKEDNSKANNAGGSQNASAQGSSGNDNGSSENIAGQALGQVKDKAASVIGEQKTNLATGINTVADSIRQIGENLRTSDENNQIASLVGKYGDTLAGRVEKLSSYIDDKELSELVRDVETFARRNPALFVGGAFALGVVAARFLKSSRQQASSNRRLKA
jgi:hypothetical protein